jgi:NADH:ubiquinone oxidoreductase subunit F (NADH-binding)/Pyruvate/2-oxoacid:ferredoxin oxidoreductase delta subunit/(2Fe-2S) ferredoxin
MYKLVEKCCDKCTHTKENLCSDYIHCLTSGPICHEDENCKQNKLGMVKHVKREKIDKPVIYLGTGTCGIGAGVLKTKEEILRYFSDKKIEFELIEVGCIGLCTQEPVMDIQLPSKNRISFGKVTDKNCSLILDSVLSEEIPEENMLGQFEGENSWENVENFFEQPFFKNQTRLVLENCGIIDPGKLQEYLAHGGYRAFADIIKTKTQEEICETILESGLRGRGGGGFKTGLKWKFSLQTSSDQKYFICNADEGDPGAFMDRAIIEGDPHRMIEGLAIAAYGIGATKAYVYIRAEYPYAIEKLEIAVKELEEVGLLGTNILDSGYNLNLKIKKGAGAFVCGEETALIHSIEGKRGMPRPRPPFPAVKGLFNKPTIINNVETLANVPVIIKKGSEWFKNRGTKGSSGTKVFALSGNVARTGLVEVEMGKTLREIIFDTGGGVPFNKKFKAVQIGGPSGGCIPEQHLDIKIDYESLKEVGAMIGSGGLVVMDEDSCMVDIAKFFMDFIQRESCGKCIPCREGTKRMLEILNYITSGKKQTGGLMALERFKGILNLEEIVDVVKSTSLCGLGQTAANPVMSTLKYFREEYETHIYERRCTAGVCKDLIEYTIITERCRGCTICAKKCPSDAIMGAVKVPHYIIPDRCIKCGVCKEVCKFDAVESQ